MNNKKGFIMVEAAIIYPIVIAAIMAIIYIMISMYIGSDLKANINIQLRSQVFSQDEVNETDKKTVINIEGHKALYESVTHSYSGNGMMRKIITRKHEATSYIIDEQDYIRKIDMIRK